MLLLLAALTWASAEPAAHFMWKIQNPPYRNNWTNISAVWRVGETGAQGLPLLTINVVDEMDCEGTVEEILEPYCTTANGWIHNQRQIKRFKLSSTAEFMSSVCAKQVNFIVCSRPEWLEESEGPGP